MARAPNILLFLTDDHGAWATGCYGNREVRSLAMDALAAEGARFANCFTPCPVCSPARACVMTGRTPSQVGVHDWLLDSDPEVAKTVPEGGWLGAEATLPALLQSAGYRCGLSGKWHIGADDRAPAGFDWYFGLPGRQGGHRGPHEYVLNGKRVTLDGVKTDLIADHALRFLDEAPASEPFFLNVGWIATHSPYLDHEEALVESYADCVFEDIPPYVPHPWHKNEGMASSNRGAGKRAREADCRIRYRNYYAAVTEMDRNVARLLDALRARGRLDDTVVVYTADHGCALGHQGFWGKGNSTRPLNMYETSLRVPLMLRYPKALPAGTTVTHCVDHYDTFRALCDFAGIDRDGEEAEARAWAGESWRALAEGRDLPDWREARYGEYGDLRMIRTPGYKLVRRYPNGPDDLFDLRKDPNETVNLANDPAHAATRAKLLAELEAWYAGHQDPAKSGLRVKELPRHNTHAEAWRDGLREAAGLQIY